ncbi:universal stress protein [Halosimplex amylolyticum]|uniref:universal stress protein n=1 Tax=Halosimplex amylolyticum TaxID=3396616 RepID=UPI003F54A910
MTGTILLSLGGVDSTEAATTEIDHAIEYALDVAQRRGGAVHALYVVDTGRYGEPALSSTEILIDDAEDAGHDLLVEAEARGRKRGIRVHTRCCHGRPNEELPAYAAEIDADAVVLTGRRVPGRVRRELERTADTVVTPGAVVGR